MATHRPAPPIWVMGLGFFPLGASGSVMLITVPQLLAANHVPEQNIASMTAVVLVPGFVSFILAPLLDWRFSRKTSVFLLTVVAAVCQFAAMLFTRDMRLMTA